MLRPSATVPAGCCWQWQRCARTSLPLFQAPVRERAASQLQRQSLGEAPATHEQTTSIAYSISVWFVTCLTQGCRAELPTQLLSVMFNLANRHCNRKQKSAMKATYLTTYRFVQTGWMALQHFWASHCIMRSYADNPPLIMDSVFMANTGKHHHLMVFRIFCFSFSFTICAECFRNRCQQ